VVEQIDVVGFARLGRQQPPEPGLAVALKEPGQGIEQVMHAVAQLWAHAVPKDGACLPVVGQRASQAAFARATRPVQGQCFARLQQSAALGQQRFLPEKALGRGRCVRAHTGL